MVGVLSVAKVTSQAAGGYADYLDAKTQAPELGDYYLKDGERAEAPGRWVAGAQLFGLDGERPVTGEQLRVLMDVRRPDNGQPLRRAGGTGQAVSAIDATFSAPKSVSAAWALADADLRGQIEQAHERAVDRAMAYALQHVAMLRRRVAADRVVHEKAAGMVATSWRHSTARSVDEQLPDPQLHSHVLLHAAVRHDGGVVAIDSRSWLVHRREVGAAYRTELAREMSELGFEVKRATGRGGRYFEIAGIPQPLIDRWSSRHHQVHAAIRQRLERQDRELAQTILEGGPAAIDAARQRQLLSETGQLSPKQERMMATASRNAKEPETVEELDHAWQATALPLGGSRERLEVLRRTASSTPVPATPRQLIDGLTEFDATFPARDARAVALERSAGMPIERGLAQLKELRDRDEILLLADGSGTTADHRGRERAVIALTQRLADTRLQPIPPRHAQREAQRLDQDLARRGGRLSDEQREAIMIACGERPLTVIEGQAGTGKSTALIGIARAHQAAGRQIIVTSTGALAAERLATELTDSGVEARAYSTAALHAALRNRREHLGPDTTVIHDEAALASTREQLRLLHAIERSGGRLIEVGDPQQSQPVGAGGLWHHLETTARDAGARVELITNQRAQDPADRRDQKRFRDGQIELAIRGYAARNHIHLHDDPAQAEDHALEQAHADRTNGLDTIVIAQTSNDRLDQLNARAQAIRQQSGQLGNQRLPVPGRPYDLHAGDEVQIRHTINDRQHGHVRNGTTALVHNIDPARKTATLQSHDGRKLKLDTEQIAQADLRLAYVQHPFPAQGHTTDTAHLIIGEHTTREGAYVALTRPRNHADIYANPTRHTDQSPDRVAALAESMSRTEPDVPSIDTPLRPGQRDPTLDHQPPRPEVHDQLTAKNERTSASDTDDHAARRRWPSPAAQQPLEPERKQSRYVGLEP